MEPSSAPWRIVEPDQTAEPPQRPADLRDLPWVVIAAGLIALAIAVAAFLLVTGPDPGVTVDGAGGGSLAPAGDAAGLVGGLTPGGDLVVEVGGAVARPGVYRLAAGSRVGDAITAAGGFGPRVDAALADTKLNLAAPVKDGDEIHVPVRGEARPTTPAGAGGTGGGAGATGTGGGGGPVDLNHATAEQLDTLPGVGPATAAKIIAAREEQPFTSIDDLGARKVVGAATLDKIRALVVVTP